MAWFWGGRSKGRDALVFFANNLPEYKENNIVVTSGSPTVDGTKNNNLSEWISSYEKMFNEKLEADLGPYFRLIYSIIRHIEKSRLSKIDTEDERSKLVYSKILRAHLNSSEVKLLMFNCASIHGKSLKGWVEKHSLLRHITRDDYRDHKLIVGEYDPKAFRFDERPTRPT